MDASKSDKGKDKNLNHQKMTTDERHHSDALLKAYFGQRAEWDHGSYSSVSSWRMQDPIYAIQHKMEILQRIHLTADEQIINVSSSNHPRDDVLGMGHCQALSPPVRGSNFKIQETLVKFCRDKQSVIQQAFDAAAFAIVRAMLMQQKQYETSKNKEQSEVGNNSTSSSSGGAGAVGVVVAGEVTEVSSINNNLLKMVDSLRQARKNALKIVTNQQTKRSNLSTSIVTKKRKRDGAKDILESSSPSSNTGKMDNTSSRSNLSKAILCAVSSIVFKELTPPFYSLDGDDNGSEDIDVLNIPQNKNKSNQLKMQSNLDTMVSSKKKENNHADGPGVNMGHVTRSAEVYSKRIVEQVQGAVLRNERRRKWRIICAQSDLKKIEKRYCMSSHSNSLDQYLKWKDLLQMESSSSEGDMLLPLLDEDDVSSGDTNGMGCVKIETDPSHQSSVKEENEEWTIGCLPRITSIMKAGSGNVIYHDMKWASRFHRIIQVLGTISTTTTRDGGETYKKLSNYGPHLIITTEMDIDGFMSMLGPISSCMSTQGSPFLRGLKYHGSPRSRRRLRHKYFGATTLSGLSESPFSVIVTTYQTLLQDFAHFCQIPFQVVVMDDGMTWLGLAHFDPNGQLGKVYNTAIWSKNDNHAGLAGKNIGWNFSADVAPEGMVEEGGIGDDKLYPLFGLTARHRFLVASSMHSKYGDVIYKAPVQALLSFVFPHFFDVLKEEWDRNKMNNCKESIEYIRSMLCRVIVVYSGLDQSFDPREMCSLAMAAMLGRETALKKSEEIYSVKAKKVLTENLIAEGKITSSRRFVSSWLRSSSPIRFELGTASLTRIIETFKMGGSTAGFLCEEIVPASSMKTIGSGVEDHGALTFKPALRCGRKFSTEQGLRQHIAAFHAPPGTWLCRTCAADCGTSHARTQHERSCGSKKVDTSTNSAEKVVSPSSKGLKAKKKQPTSTNAEIRDMEGNLLVPGYNGVWVNSGGKYFVKIERNASQKSTLARDEFFDHPDEAAKRYDEIIISQPVERSQLNFKPDGSRIQYDNSCSASIHGKGMEVFGSGSANVVPALAVINIKDLPEGVVPLLRDPRQTLKGGGNIKRHVYKYRGVCRQARKGHDRWQSQISFGGHNHYLGTFDTEWDAAAIYAWAHLILYGEEATKKAQREGEEAVASYERQLKGETVEEVPKKIKKPKAKIIKSERCESNVIRGNQHSSNISDDMKHGNVKKVTVEYPRCNIEQLISSCSERILAQSKDNDAVSMCISVAGLPEPSFPIGCAMLVGLCSDDCDWRPENFVDSIKSSIPIDEEYLLALIRSECSLNTRFKTLMQGIPCFIGKASQALEQAAATLGLYGIDVGGTIGVVDCNIGGIGGSCNEIASCISYCRRRKEFLFFSCTEDDIVTLNGMRLKSFMGPLTVGNGDVISVGSRVFMFILPDE